MMRVLMLLIATTLSSGFTVGASVGGTAQRAASPKMADIGDTGVSFDKVAREW